MEEDLITQQTTDGRWYALQVRPTKESKVLSSLSLKGYECLLPCTNSRRLTGKSASSARKALFPGYLFCRLDIRQSRMPLLVTPDVFGLVGFRGNPVPVEDEEIAAIQIIVESGVSFQPWPYIKPGIRVRLLGGPLRGLHGVVKEQTKSTCLIVSVELLQRSISVEILPEWAYPSAPATTGFSTTSFAS